MPARFLMLLVTALVALPALSQASLETLINDIEPSVIEWRRDFHANPELSNREFRSAGRENINLIDAVTGAEDFSFFAREVPGLYVYVGGKPLNVPADENVSHHTPDFYIDESGMKLGLKTYVNLALDYMEMAKGQ